MLSIFLLLRVTFFLCVRLCVIVYWMFFTKLFSPKLKLIKKQEYNSVHIPHITFEAIFGIAFPLRGKICWILPICKIISIWLKLRRTHDSQLGQKLDDTQTVKWINANTTRSSESYGRSEITDSLDCPDILDCPDSLDCHDI